MTNMTELQRDIFDSAFTSTYKMVSSLLALGNWTMDQVEEEIKTKIKQINEFMYKGMMDTAYRFIGNKEGLIKALSDHRRSI